MRIESGDEAVEVAGTAVGPRNLPHLVRVWGESFYMPFADHIVVFRYKDQPGMIGRVGTIFGEQASTSSPPPSAPRRRATRRCWR